MESGQMGAHDKTLLAFYDLTVSPLSYDFLSFLVVAEEERLALETAEVAEAAADDS